MKLGRLLADKVSFVSDIRRLGRNIISINFKYRHEANWFVENENLLPEGWISYIPNYKILKIGIVRGVYLSLNERSDRAYGFQKKTLRSDPYLALNLEINLLWS